MLIVSPATAQAFAPHAAEKAWVMFVQVNPPSGGIGPILIEGIGGARIAMRLRQLSEDNAFETVLIGLLETTTPREHAAAIAEQYGGHLHDGWYEPTAALLAYVQHVGQPALQLLLEQTHPGALDESLVDSAAIAAVLGVSVQTIRRMVKAKQIPFIKLGDGHGAVYRFVPRDVIASLHRR